MIKRAMNYIEERFYNRSDHGEFRWKFKKIRLRNQTVMGQIFLDDSVPHFDGHFPLHPIFPGVAQLQIIEAALEEVLKKTIQITQIPRLKFSSRIEPETLLSFTIDMELNSESKRARWRLYTKKADVASGDIRFFLG